MASGEGSASAAKPPATDRWWENDDPDLIFLPTVSEGPANELVPNLYLGNLENASDLIWLKVEGITHVLSVQVGSAACCFFHASPVGVTS